MSHFAYASPEQDVLDEVKRVCEGDEVKAIKVVALVLAALVESYEPPSQGSKS
jgi:hypothetical protein